MKMPRILLLSLGAAWALVWCAAPVAAEVYDLSKLPESPNWKQLSWEERKAAATVPPEILQGMGTADLVETCLRHPFRMLFMPSDVLDRGMDAVIESSSCFEELLERPDAGHELLEKYLSVDPAECLRKADLRQRSMFGIDLRFLELMLARPSVMAKLSELERSRLAKHCAEIYDLRLACGKANLESISLLIARALGEEGVAYAGGLSTDILEEFRLFIRGEARYCTCIETVIDHLRAQAIASER